MAPLVDGTLRVGADLTGVAAHDGAQDGEPGTPTDDSGHDRDEDADRRGHPCTLEERGDDAEGRTEGRPQRDVQTRLEGLEREVLRQHRQPVAHGGEHHHKDDGTQGSDGILLARAIETHSEPGPDCARPQHGDRKRHDTGSKPAERLNPLGAPQREPDGQEEDHRGQKPAGPHHSRSCQPSPEAFAGPHVGRQAHGIERVVHRGEDDREDQPEQEDEGPDDRHHRRGQESLLGAREEGGAHESGGVDSAEVQDAEDCENEDDRLLADGVPDDAELEANQLPNHDRPSSEWTPPTREVKRSPRSPPCATSSVVPATSTRPLSMMATCVHSCWTVAITCDDRMTVPPRFV